MADLVPIRRALLSVSDKQGLVELARALAARGAALVSTGGTAAALRSAGLLVTEVSEVSGFPEILEGRVKTLVPQIHGGILGRRDDPTHRAQMQAHAIAPIDLVVVNLYPFEVTAAAGGDFDACIETIDIGGPALIRAAAKNHADVAVLVEPGQYPALLDELAARGGTTAATRRGLAAAAFARTAAYDAAIAQWFTRVQATPFPSRLILAGTLRETLRYGENPHQPAALYATAEARPGPATGVASARQVQGKALSYNNIADADAALECVAEFERPAVAIVKHANPCGVAVADTPVEAWAAALACDPVSAFGGIVALNRTLDAATAAAIAGIFTEVIMAPEADEAARAVLAGKPNLRLLLSGAMPDPRAAGVMVRSVAGGLLVQARDSASADAASLHVVTRRAPDDAELADLLFTWRVCKHVKSNAIVYARGGATVGIGAGQMSRVDAARQGARKAAETAAAAGLAVAPTQGAVAASDAFFPFADGLQVLIDAGVTAVIQPGGSVRDAEVVAAANTAGIAMVFTGMRHFRH